MWEAACGCWFAIGLYSECRFHRTSCLRIHCNVCHSKTVLALNTASLADGEQPDVCRRSVSIYAAQGGITGLMNAFCDFFPVSHDACDAVVRSRRSSPRDECTFWILCWTFMGACMVVDSEVSAARLWCPRSRTRS